MTDTPIQNRQNARPDFEKMQEISRHAIHAREALTVMIDTLEKMYQDQKQVYESRDTGLETSQWGQTQSHLQFQLQMVKSLRERSISNLERHNSEITLVRNQAASLSPLRPAVPDWNVY
jgi:hypothetical protein